MQIKKPEPNPTKTDLPPVGRAISVCRPLMCNETDGVVPQVLYKNWARPGLIIPRQWNPDEKITNLIRQYYGIPVSVYFRWLRYYTVWLIGPAIAGLVWFLYGLITTRQDRPT